MYNWVDYIIQTENKVIFHHLNSGREKRIGPFLMDGFDNKTNTVYEFHGCYFHGHE